MYEEKDWIALDCCPICGKERGIAFDNRMKKSMPKHVVSSIDLCDDCLKDAKENGWFIVYETTDEFVGSKVFHKPTGRFMKLNFNALSTETPGYEQINKIRVCLISEKDFNTISKGIKDASGDDSENSSVVA